jgi:hypothetical protein
MESMRVLADIGAGEGPSPLKEATSPPRRRPIAFEVDGRQHRADLYLPGDEALASMVLVPGVAPAGRDDPKLVAFANTLARARFEVLVPDLPRLRALQVSGDDARVLADAAIHLDRRSANQPLAMTAISYAAGPAVAALFEPDMKGRVMLVITVGGYYDLQAVITFFTTGYYRAGAEAPWQYRRPNTYGKWVFVLSNAPRLDDPADTRALEAMARRKIGDPDADVSDLTEGLGPDGRAVEALLANRDPDQVPALLAALPPPIVAEVHALDLAAATSAPWTRISFWFTPATIRSSRKPRASPSPPLLRREGRSCSCSKACTTWTPATSTSSTSSSCSTPSTPCSLSATAPAGRREAMSRFPS